MEIIESKMRVDALIERYKALRKDLADLLEGANGPEDAEQFERLTKELRGQIDRIRKKTVERVNPTIEDYDGNVLPRPKVGDTVQVWRFESGDIVTGTIIKDDGDEITVEVPEKIIPPKPQKVIQGFTVTAEWEWEHRQWVDWSASEEAEELNK